MKEWQKAWAQAVAREISNSPAEMYQFRKAVWNDIERHVRGLYAVKFNKLLPDKLSSKLTREVIMGVLGGTQDGVFEAAAG